MNYSSYDVGTKVRLASGGPLMTVTSVNSGGSLQCTWYRDGTEDFKSATFNPSALVRVADDD